MGIFFHEQSKYILFADGFLAIACIGGIMYLLQEREIKKKRFGLFYSRLPSLEALDKLNHHCLSIGFPLFTLGLITGLAGALRAAVAAARSTRR